VKTITKNTKATNNVSLYLFEDSETLVISKDNITVGDPVKFIIGDCNSTNITLHEGVSSPDKWVGHKYTYDGTSWALNSNYKEPEE
jgi:hypothetical protein